MARLLSSLPVGAKVVDPNTKYNGKPITWLVGGHNHYAQGQSVLVSEKIITLKSFDAKELSNADSSRKNYGNNRYSVSNIRQWLNSDKVSWYSAQHSADAPPNNANVYINYNEYDTEAGFLTNFSADLRNALIPTSLTVAKNTVTDGGGSETVTDKVFLLSNTEVGLTNENGIVEGKRLALFTTADNSRLAYPTEEAVSKSGYKNPTNLTTLKAWYYWLRSLHAGGSSNVRCVYLSGALGLDYAYFGNYGVRPALNLSSDVVVSGTPNSNGEYKIIISTIETSGGAELGSIEDNTSILKYTPRDYSVGTTVIEKINGVVVGTKTIVNDTEYTVSATTAQWNAVKFGKYKDTLGNKNVVTLEVSTGKIYTYPFTKALPTTAKTNDVLVAVNDMSNIAMPSHKKKLMDAIGNKATVGGTGTLEDIAKAVDSINLESINGVPVARGTTTIPSSGKLTISGLNFKPQLLVYISTRKNYLGYRAVAVVGREGDYTGDPYSNVSFQEHSNGTYKPSSIFTDTSITMNGASSVSGETINYIVYGGGTIL